ncbi:mechanosensitive ion channel [Ideonella sp. B7]|uniref:mechanosensitive ion channel family protein n=1 Tax=Ideonella benzenivorans TaxID=2831643 RepID=UPI001CECE49B|nr:mechanosensitive ion channel domain-containing protein [Ideonella benzenivorans]MCA6217636.1 mechanosensitive ion channel [Ideonella benzenivorans]
MTQAPVIPVLTLDEFLSALTHPSALIESGVVLVCLALAWLAVRVLRGPASPERSIWYGRRIVDGVLFPMLALGLAYLARRLLLGWGVPLAMFKIVLPVLMSFASIRLSVRVLTVAFPESRVVRLVERTISWLAWLAVVGWITGVLPEILNELDDIRWKLGNSVVSVRSLLEGALSVGVVMVITLWISAALENQLLKGATGDQLSLRMVGANLVRTLLTFVGLLLALSSAGIDLSALSVLGGAVGVGVGFGLQRLASNYVSGFVILAERSVRIGDTVLVDGFEGRITKITTRYTVIRALNGREAIVPNELLITQRVENCSLADPKVLVSTVVQVGYGSDLDALFPQIIEAVKSVPRVLQDPKPGVLLSNFAADGLELTITFWIIDPENGQGGVRSEVNLAVWRLLNRLGVEIPFPQRVVQLLPASATPPAA